MLRGMRHAKGVQRGQAARLVDPMPREAGSETGSEADLGSGARPRPRPGPRLRLGLRLGLGLVPAGIAHRAVLRNDAASGLSYIRLQPRLYTVAASQSHMVAASFTYGYRRDLRDEVAPSLRNRFAGLVPEVYKAPAAHLAMVRVGLRLRARVRDGVGVRVRVTSMPFATAHCCEPQACLGLGLGQVRASPNREPSPNPMHAPGVCSPDCSGGLLLLARRRRAARRACEGRPVSP